MKTFVGRVVSWFRSLKEGISAKAWMALACIVGLGLVGSGLVDRFIAPRAARASSAMLGAMGSAVVVSSGAAPSSASATASSSASSSAPPDDVSCDTGGKIALNTATEAELEKLPGVGPSKAAKIIELRTKLGKFTRLEDLYRIKGIKRRLLEKIRPHAVLDPPPGCADAASVSPMKAK